MAELVDAPDSKSGDGNIVGVRFPLPAPSTTTIHSPRFLNEVPERYVDIARSRSVAALATHVARTRSASTAVIRVPLQMIGLTSSSAINSC